MMTEDLTPFFDTGDFATAAIYRRGDGSVERGVNVIFDDEYLEALGVQCTGPAALGMAADFSDWAESATLEIDGDRYKLNKPQPRDDGAIVLLKLELKE